jgi:hypothetical protein
MKPVYKSAAIARAYPRPLRRVYLIHPAILVVADFTDGGNIESGSQSILITINK